MLNRDVKQFGKKFLFDGQDDTCWNSDQVSRPRGYRIFFLCSTQLSLKFQMLINTEIAQIN